MSFHRTAGPPSSPLARVAAGTAGCIVGLTCLAAVVAAFHVVSSSPWRAESPQLAAAVSSCRTITARPERDRCLGALAGVAASPASGFATAEVAAEP